MGRPKNNEPELSLLPVKKYLEQVLNVSIGFSTLYDYLSRNENQIENKIVLLENIRYYPEETKQLETTSEFRNKLTSLGDVYVNDAFGCSHREHSSIVGINCNEKCNGLLIEKEIKFLKNIFEGKEGVSTLILGGSKINDKIKLINNLIPKVNYILIGGGMAFTFLKMNGYDIGLSYFDSESIVHAEKIVKYAL